MKNLLFKPLLVMALMVISATGTWAHFGMIIPSDDIVSKDDNKKIELKIQFMHPFEGHYMNMEMPKAFKVMMNGKKSDLLSSLRKESVDGFTTWETEYRVKRPGDMIFFAEPVPYWEPAEESFIIHYTKVVVNAFGLEKGWDSELGLKTEIVPLSRPYGLWVGNVFQGIVKKEGKAVPYAEVEVEYYNYNEDGQATAPAGAYVTQVIKADSNGVFTYAMPKAGWWGFAALSTAEYKLEHKGREYPVETGAVLWVRTREMK